MDFVSLVNSLARFPRVLHPLVAGLQPDQATWKPLSGNWSILEIVCHLGDEEVEDFRPRVQLTLQAPTQRWPSINPPQAAIDRKYNEQDLEVAVKRFLDERKKSLAWLDSLEEPNWDLAYPHFPKHGPVPVGEVMASWAAHDHLHLRQIAKRLYELNERDSGSYGVQYAGGW